MDFFRVALAGLVSSVMVWAGTGPWRTGPRMPLPRAGCQVAGVGGRILVAGGSYWEKGTKHWSARADWFDPATGKWAAAPALPAPRSDAAAVAVDDEVWLFGGMRGEQAFDDALVLRGGAWVPVAAAKLPEPRVYASVVRLGRKLYLGGGIRAVKHYETASAVIWQYDLDNPSAGWTEFIRIPSTPRANFGLLGEKNSLWVFGGTAHDPEHTVRNLADCHRYDLENRKWTRLADLPEANRALTVTTAGAEIFVVGGYVRDFETRTWFYSTQMDSWRPGPALPHGVADGRVVNTDGRVTLVTGEAGSGIRAPWIFTAPADRALIDVEYGRVNGKPLLLDLYLPFEAKGPLPVILSIHGGGWHGGSKRASPGMEFTRRGFAVASLEYRLVGEAEFPAQIDDCKTAVRWLRANAAKYGLDRGRIGAWGASAGGHLAALLGTSGEGDARIQAVVDYFGPIDVYEWRRAQGATSAGLVYGPLADARERLKAANPITFLKPDAPPFLVAQGAEDKLVPPVQSQLLVEALKQAGVPVDFRLVPGAGHSVKQMNLDDDVERFLRKALKLP